MCREGTTCELPGTIHARMLQNIYMGERSPRRVIVDKRVTQYVGIGWIPLKEVTEDDYRQYPVVVFDEKE